MSHAPIRVAARLERKVPGRALGLLLALSFGIAGIVPAKANSSSDAEKLLRLDIMLMVTALRCRKTSDNFWTDYGRFTARHMGALNGASHDLGAGMSRRLGPAGARKALDRLRVTIANRYGVGHPWLDCRQLKMVARNLAQVEGRATLVEAADQLLASRASGQFALAEK